MSHNQIFHNVLGRTDSDAVKQTKYGHWARYSTFFGLLITSTLCSLLLAANFLDWSAPGYLFHVAVALAVQLFSSLLGLIHVAVVCRLINYALRLRLDHRDVTLDVLRTWVDST